MFSGKAIGCMSYHEMENSLAMKMPSRRENAENEIDDD